MLKKDLLMIGELTDCVVKNENEDKRKKLQNDKDAKKISRKIKKVDMNYNIQFIDDAFLQMMNYELYQKAIEYKKRELDDVKKQKQADKETIQQRKIDEKTKTIHNLRNDNAKITEKLNEYNAASEELARSCSGNLELFPRYRDDLG